MAGPLGPVPGTRPPPGPQQQRPGQEGGPRREGARVGHLPVAASVVVPGWVVVGVGAARPAAWG